MKSPKIKFPLSRATNHFISYAMSDDVFGYRLGISGLHRLFAGFSIPTFSRLISFSLWIFDTNGVRNHDVQIRLAKLFLRESSVNRVEASLSNEKYPFFPQQFCICLKYLLRYGTIDSGSYPIDESFKALGICLLSINDSLDRDYQRRYREHSEIHNEDLYFDLITTSLWSNDEDFLNVIFRYYKIFDKYWKNQFLAHKLNTNYAEIFTNTTGLCIDDYLYYWSLTYLKYHNLKEKGLDPDFINDFTLSPNSYFSLLNDKYQSFVDFLRNLSLSIDEYKTILSQESNRGLLFDFSVFKKFPFLRINEDSYLMISLTYFVESLNAVMFWRIFDELRNTANHLHFSEDFGKCFQSYTADLIQFIHSRNPSSVIHLEKIIQLHSSDYHTPDIIYETEDDIFIFEVSSGRFSNDATLVEGDFFAYQQDLENKIIHKFDQIFKFLNLVSHHEIDYLTDNLSRKNIFPVLVTLENMQPTLLLYQIIEKAVSRFNVNLNVKPCSILDIRDIELLVRTKNLSFEDDFINWISTKAYLISLFRGTPKKKLIHDEENIIKKELDVFFQKMKASFKPDDIL